LPNGSAESLSMKRGDPDPSVERDDVAILSPHAGLRADRVLCRLVCPQRQHWGRSLVGQMHDHAARDGRRSHRVVHRRLRRPSVGPVAGLIGGQAPFTDQISSHGWLAGISGATPGSREQRGRNPSECMPPQAQTYRPRRKKTTGWQPSARYPKLISAFPRTR